jgi:hypothetical protein
MFLIQSSLVKVLSVIEERNKSTLKRKQLSVYV